VVANLTTNDVESLKELLMSRMDNMETLINAKFESMKITMNLRDSDYERRLVSLNKLTDKFQETDTTFVTKDSCEKKHDDICEKIDSLTSFKDNLNGKLAILSIASSALTSIIVALVVWFLTK
jgi:hypothetical protein